MIFVFSLEMISMIIVFIAIFLINKRQNFGWKAMSLLDINTI